MIRPGGRGPIPPQPSRGGERQGSALGSAPGPSPQPWSGGGWASVLNWPPPGPVDPLPPQSPHHTSCGEVACFREFTYLSSTKDTPGERGLRECAPAPTSGQSSPPGPGRARGHLTCHETRGPSLQVQTLRMRRCREECDTDLRENVLLLETRTNKPKGSRCSCPESSVPHCD